MTAPFCLPAFGCAAHCDQVSCRPRQGKLWELRLFGAVLGVSEEKHKGGIPTRKPIMGLQSWTCVDLRGPAGTFGGPSCTFVDLRGPSGHLRGPSWTFVDLRGPWWTFVDLRGPSCTFVDLRGWASNLRGAAWDLRGGSWIFVLIQPRLGGPRGVGAEPECTGGQNT